MKYIKIAFYSYHSIYIFEMKTKNQHNKYVIHINFLTTRNNNDFIYNNQSLLIFFLFRQNKTHRDMTYFICV